MLQKQAEKFINTEEFAKFLLVKPATVRRGLCVNGHYLVIKPLKLPNGRLLWPESAADKILLASEG